MAGDWFDEQGAPPPASSPAPGGGGGGDDWFSQYGPPAAPASAPAGSAGGGGGGVDRNAVQAFIAQWQQTHAPGEGIGPLAAAVAQQFPGVTRYMYGATPSNNELSIGGEKYKVIGGEDSPTSSYWYTPGTDDSPGFGGGGYGGGFGGGGYGGLDPSQYDSDFAARNADPGYRSRLGLDGQLEMDPGYQFRLQEGAKALEHSAAAKGTLLTGGTLKGLARYAQDYASGEFMNRYSRMLGEEQMRYGRALGEQQNRYNQLSGLTALGQASAAGQAAANQQYGNAASGLTTDIGNAQAAGTVGGANAWTNAAGQVTNAAQQAAQQYYLSRLFAQGNTGTGTGGNPVYTPGQGMPPWRG